MAAKAANEKFLPAQRRREITRFVAENGHASITDLAEMFTVSEDTIRRDLEQLTRRGSVLRTYGGVVKPEGGSSVHYSSFEARAQRNLDAKRSIGAAAARLVPPGSTVLVNGGTTVLEFAKALSAHHRLTVVTNNLRLPALLPEGAAAEVHILAGQYDPASLVTLGPVQLPSQFGAEVHRLFADCAVVGVGGVAAQAGFTGTDVRESSMIRAMMDQSATVIVVADSSKFDRQALVTIAELASADYLVSDAAPEAALATALDDARVNVVISSEGKRPGPTRAAS
jgi:DeoR family fructose operon transcriptional repressor